MTTGMPITVSELYSNESDIITLLHGSQPHFNASDSLGLNTSTTVYDLTSTEDLTIPFKLSPDKGSFELAISEAAVKMFSHITRSFINPITGILGFAGNSLGLGVLWRQAKQQKLSIFWYLCTLTLVDILFLSLAVIDGIPRVVQAFDKDLAKYLIAHFRLGLAYFDMIFLHSARYIVLVMSCERLVSVVRPLHVKDTWFAKYPMRIMFACLFFNVIFLLPIIINATVVILHVRGNTEYIFTFRNYDTFMAQYWIVEAVVHSFIPMIFLVAVNIAIPVQFYRTSIKLRSVRNKKSNDTANYQGKITATVMVITVMYLFLSIPLIVVKVLQYVNPDFNMNGRYRLVFWFLADLGKCLAYLNAANDFLVFFLVSNNYRAIFKAMYCWRCSRGLEKHRKKKYETDEKSSGIKESSTAGGSKATLASTVTA